jgi:dTDP-4-amino-4,6-dideoxygalactose transaminase
MSVNPINIPILDLKPQYNSIKGEIHAAIDRVLESGAFIMGPDVKLFEEEVAQYLGVKHAIGVNSGTDALVIGLRALGIGVGDEVITTPFSFVDVDARTFNIDPSKIEAAITSRTKAIMPVHLYGQPAAMSRIMAIANAHGLKVIEDCAQSFGARYMGSCLDCGGCDAGVKDGLVGKQTGSIGDVGAYSFFPSKNLGAYGDGGLVATNDDQIGGMARMLRAHGARKKYHNEILGYNSRLDTLQAAILRVKLPYIDQWNQGRKRVAKIYRDLLSEVSDVTTPEVLEGHVFHQYTIRVARGRREQLAQSLSDQGIGTMIYYPIPQDKLPVYNGQYESLSVSELLSSEVISLPIWPELDEAIQKRIALAVIS